MSWYNECTLNYEDFENIRLYLIDLQRVSPRRTNDLALKDMISKLEAWLNPEEEREE